MAQQFDPGAAINDAREKASAVRAARLDAMRQLGEAIQGVRIDAKTTVQDFVTESDEIHAQFSAFLQGAQQDGEPTIYEDGTAEVKMVIFLNEVIVGLQEIRANNYSNSVSSPDQFGNMNYPGRKFEAYGTGAMKTEPMPPMNIDIWAYVNGRGRSMARRAAITDAYRNMLETVQGIHIDSQTTVEDFMCTSDRIDASVKGMIQGVEIDRNTEYRRDGLCVVTARLDLNKMIQQLAQMSSQYYKGNQQQFQPQAFDQIRLYFPSGVIICSGVGAPPPNCIGRTARYDGSDSKPPYNYNPNPPEPTKPSYPPLPVPPRPNLPPPPKPPQRFVPEWANKTITVTGTGAYPEGVAPGQARGLAERAAQVDAMRLLAEQAVGVKLQGQTTVEEFIATSDVITTEINTYIRGATPVGQARHFPRDGYAEVDMELWLGDMWEIIDAEYQQVLKRDYRKELSEYQPDILRYQGELDMYKQEIEAYKRQYGSMLSSQDQGQMQEYMQNYQSYQQYYQEFQTYEKQYK
jgi:hypothetical protein